MQTLVQQTQVHLFPHNKLSINVMISSFKKILKYTFIFILIGSGVSTHAFFSDGIISKNNHSALLCVDDKCTTTSQINFSTTKGRSVYIRDSNITGDIWSETMGWINLDPSPRGVQNTTNGILSGYAWGENAGWINFSPTKGGVSINSLGQFSGYAWSENFGWIKFDCSVTNACVETDWRPLATRTSTSLTSGGYLFRTTPSSITLTTVSETIVNSITSVVSNILKPSIKNTPYQKQDTLKVASAKNTVQKNGTFLKSIDMVVVNIINESKNVIDFITVSISNFFQKAFFYVRNIFLAIK